MSLILNVHFLLLNGDMYIYVLKNKERVDQWEGNITHSGKVAEVPHVSWWTVGNDAIAMTEMPIGTLVP